MFQILIMYKGKMPTPFIAALKERRLVAKQTLEFVLQRPNGFEFQAGQSVNLKVFELTFEDARQGRRRLTIASPPHEENLVFATRLTGSGFKNTLLQGPLQEIEINGPHGKMVHDPSLPAVFIAGGIGVTPFRSMTLQALRNSTGKRITFLYSNKSKADAAYHQVFADLMQKHENFIYTPTITAADESEWDGERGRIDAAFLRNHVDVAAEAKYYVCGPPKMVQAIIEILKHESVREENILSESFWGYNS